MRLLALVEAVQGSLEDMGLTKHLVDVACVVLVAFSEWIYELLNIVLHVLKVNPGDNWSMAAGLVCCGTGRLFRFQRELKLLLIVGLRGRFLDNLRWVFEQCF